MVKLNKTDLQIKFKQGVEANINANATQLFAVEGEPHWTTDTDKLYIFDGNNNIRVHGLDIAVMYEDEVVSMGGEILWLT